MQKNYKKRGIFKMKKFFALIAAGMMAVTMTGCGGSTAPATTDKATDKTANLVELEDMVASGKMTIGYTLINPLNYFDSQTNELVGFETEFAKAVCEKLGVEAVFQEIDWDSKEIELNSKNIDCIWNGMTITPEREETMSISVPYMENRQVIIVKAENADKYRESFDGANVVAEQGSAGEELVQGDESFASAKYTAVASQATALMEVSSGTADVAVIDYTMAGGSVGEGTDYADLVFVDKGYESESYGIAFRKGSDVTNKVNEIISELAADGTIGKIAEKYGLSDLILVK